MNKLEERILKFLLTSSVYSENAIMMNFGINYEELINVFQILENEGYLEAYSTYLEREKLNEVACCKTKKSRLVIAVSLHVLLVLMIAVHLILLVKLKIYLKLKS